jgi:hypothetical protein
LNQDDDDDDAAAAAGQTPPSTAGRPRRPHHPPWPNGHHHVRSVAPAAPANQNNASAAIGQAKANPSLESGPTPQPRSVPVTKNSPSGKNTGEARTLTRTGPTSAAGRAWPHPSAEPQAGLYRPPIGSVRPCLTVQPPVPAVGSGGTSHRRRPYRCLRFARVEIGRAAGVGFVWRASRTHALVYSSSLSRNLPQSAE